MTGSSFLFAAHHLNEAFRYEQRFYVVNKRGEDCVQNYIIILNTILLPAVHDMSYDMIFM